MSIIFGRFTDAFKPKSQVEKWSECEKLFNDKKYFESYVLFFEYLKDLETENVFYSLDNQILKFQFIQGSKEVRGFFDGKSISAISVISGFEKTNVAIFRKLMEMNFSFYYSRFAIKDNKIVIKFNSSVLDCTPNKLYYGLRELALRADKQDDIMISEFKSLIIIESKSESYTPEQIIAMKKYFRKWISETLLRVSLLNREQYSGGISYIYLNLLYRIDYFLIPQGNVLNDLEKMSWTYFNDKESSTSQKIDILENDFKKILEYEDSKLESNFYKVKATFGLVQPANKKSLEDVINNNIQNIKWYIDNNHNDIALDILEYIVGYALFTYGLNKSLRIILGIIMRVINNDYVGELCGKTDFDFANQDFLNKDSIVKAISEAIEIDKPEYPELSFNFDNLKFDTKINFVKTTLEELLKLNYNN